MEAIEVQIVRMVHDEPLLYNQMDGRNLKGHIRRAAFFGMEERLIEEHGEDNAPYEPKATWDKLRKAYSTLTRRIEQKGENCVNRMHPRSIDILDRLSFLANFIRRRN
ncbi:hypothetical protein TKK_0000073 [Trichogramma kaykai]